ncbi:S26 family signal peptidase [Plantactinospora siamensis]|uniref:S26 family signal peptidase n=1 Tax=Plantactinospora siamensis TaxID=555372 RepID=A0ABV6P3H7_9ACTN
MRIWLIVAAVVVAAAAAGLGWLRRHLVRVSVVGRSMEPTLRAGDRVLARRVPLTAVRPGDVVVVRAPARMAGPAGPGGPGGDAAPAAAVGPGRPARRGGSGPDPAQRPARGLLIKRAYAVPGDPVPVDRVPALRGGADRVPAGSLVVLGDNPPFSYDSRECGYIPAADVIGVVIRPRLPGP